TNAYLVVVTYNCDLIAALQLIHGLLRNYHGAFFHVGDKTHVSKLSGPQNIPRIRKRYIVADRAGLDVKAAIERIKAPFTRIQLAVTENQFELKSFHVLVALFRIRMPRNKIRERSFASRHDCFDRINLRHGCERSRSWPDQIADLIVRKS